MFLYKVLKLSLKNVLKLPVFPHYVSPKHYFYTYSLEPAQPIPGRTPCIVDTPIEAVQCIKTCDLVFVQGAAATPLDLVTAMTEHGKQNKLQNVKICHMHTEGKAEYCYPENNKIFRSISFFMGKNVRKAVEDGRGDSIPIFLHEIPLLFHKKILCPDVALISVSPPDEHGYCSLGTSVDCVRAGIMHAKTIIAQINKQLPRTFGDGMVHMSHFDVAVCVDHKLPTHDDAPPTEAEHKMGELIAEHLVDNGATLQLGIGSIPNAVLDKLHQHKDLGIHSEMFSEGVVKLFNNGCITNHKKKIHQGRIIGSFLIGSKVLYDFVNNNPAIELLDIYYVNHTKTVSQNPKMTAINSAIEVDLTGQVCSDSIGPRMYSGFGGQVDFIRGAAEGYDGLGKPIIVMQAATKKGVSKIVPFLKEGAGVVTSRAHVHYVVTEYGIASLFGKTLRQRAHALIQIADPKHRKDLEKAAYDRLKCMPEP